MRITSYKYRFSSGCLALALAAGFNPAVPAKDGSNQPPPSSYANIFLGEIEPTRYSEVQTAPGIIGEVEVVRERYADGKVRVERQVTLDGEGNYVNHGAWKLFSTAGDVAAEGQYNFGQRVGTWTRWVGPKDSTVLGEFPFKQFKAPFMSQATFVDGKMEGDWTITDANERKAMVVTLKSGQRNGTATMWLPNGKICWQATYHHSVPVGDLFEMNSKMGEAELTASFDNGHRIVTKTENYPRNKQIKSEVTYLAAKSTAKATDDFWTTSLAKYAPEGKDERHGAIKTWFANGQQEQEGTFKNGKKSGVFKFWHENGQLASTGEYRDDKTEGDWTWYYQNGQKSSVGKYENGTLVGNWRWWDEQGKLTKQQTFNGTESATTQKAEHVEVSKRSARSHR